MISLNHCQISHSLLVLSHYWTFLDLLPLISQILDLLLRFYTSNHIGSLFIPPPPMKGKTRTGGRHDYRGKLTFEKETQQPFYSITKN